jgi:hypothetical protein
MMSAVESNKIAELTAAIKEKKICDQSKNIVECSHAQFKVVAKNFADPTVGQAMFAEIVKNEIEKNPEQGRFLRDQYYIYTADLYVQSLKKKSFLSRFPIIGRHNISVQVAAAFLKSMNDYSNRREVDRAIASETILQEVTNFNYSLTELNRIISKF